MPNPFLSLDPTLSVVVTTDTYHGFGHYGTLPTPICVGYPAGSPGWHSSELYSEDDPSYGSWVCLGDTQVQLWAGDDSGPLGTRLSYDEMGPMVLRPDGTSVQFGANSNSANAILSNTFPPTWSAGPSFPTDSNGDPLTVEDGPAVLLPNGNVLVAASPQRDMPPSEYFELTAAPSNTLVQVSGPSYASQIPSGYVEMLMLPTGQVWLTPNRGYGGSIIEIYTPNFESLNGAWAPTISGCVVLCTFSKSNVNNRITGTQFNGLSQDSAYGDEFQSATNYPLVRISTLQSTNYYYCRTHDHGILATGGVSMGVATGSEPVYTEFDCSATGLPTNELGFLEVVANGISSFFQLVYITP